MANARVSVMSKVKKAPAPFVKEKRDFIKKMVKAESLNWPREMKIMNSLWKKYPDPVFWITLSLGFQLNSLAWFIGDGQDELIRQWNFLQLDRKRKQSMIDEKTYADLPLFTEEKQEFKPRTMKDWIKQST